MLLLYFKELVSQRIGARKQHGIFRTLHGDLKPVMFTEKNIKGEMNTNTKMKCQGLGDFLIKKQSFQLGDFTGSLQF